MSAPQILSSLPSTEYHTNPCEAAEATLEHTFDMQRDGVEQIFKILVLCLGWDFLGPISDIQRCPQNQQLVWPQTKMMLSTTENRTVLCSSGPGCQCTSSTNVDQSETKLCNHGPKKVQALYLDNQWDTRQLIYCGKFLGFIKMTCE